MKIQTSGFFAAAHFLSDYEGKCKNIHGHEYAYFIEADAIDVDKQGMVFDFGLVKKLFDHKLIIQKKELPFFDTKFKDRFEIFVMSKNPTAENMVELVAKKLVNEEHIDKVKVRIWEDVKSLIDENKLKKGEGEFVEVTKSNIGDVE